MLPISVTSVPVYLAAGATDMRKSIRGLSMEVHEYFEVNLFSGAFFAFCSRNRKIIKILAWDTDGFCLWMKRLEKGRFPWPECEKDVLKISSRQFAWMLSGSNIKELSKIPEDSPPTYKYLT